MRTFTVVPSFEGESAYFDLPDIGFQGDHLSFAILFNLTELVEHWPNLLPSMIVTDPKGNTYIAPHTSWSNEKHIFTWAISSTETTYDGNLMCQLKCISADDPETIVCMSRICQTRVYQSLEAATDPPEAFQTWIDTLVALGSEINADASVVLESVETTQTNARTAQAAAEEAELHKNAAQQARNNAEQVARVVSSAVDGASQAQQRAQNAATSAEAASTSANEAKIAAEAILEETDLQASAAATSASSASDSASQASASMVAANTAKIDAQAARDAAIAAQEEAEQNLSDTESARDDAVLANSSAQSAKTSAEAARTAAQTAQANAETARQGAETARDNSDSFAEASKKWAIGKNKNDQDVLPTDSTYHNNSLYWANQSALSANEANSAKTAILNAQVTSVSYSSADKSITFFVGGNAVSNNVGG